MVDSVLRRLQEFKRESSTVNGDVVDRMYSNLINDIQVRAKNDARAESIAELDAARAEKLVVEAERDAARVLQASSESKCDDLTAKCEGLEAELRSKVRAVAVGKKSLTDGIEPLKIKVSNRDAKIQELEVIIAELRGNLAAVGNRPTQQIMPQAIPSFEFNPVRDANGRISSVTAKPVLQ